MSFIRHHFVVIIGAVLLIPASAGAETVAFVAAGEAGRGARRAVIRCHQLFVQADEFVLLESQELRRALAGLPARGEGDDPLADVRALVVEAGGDEARSALGQLGERIGVDILITVRQAGDEVEYRGFNVERRAFYRGTLMLRADAPPEAEVVRPFVVARARTADGAAPRADGSLPSDVADEEVAEGGSEREPFWHRWWFWVLVGGGVAAAALVAYFVAPSQVEDQGVTLRIVVP